MNRFAAGILAGISMGAAGIILMSDNAFRRKLVDKGEDILEKAEDLTEKYGKRR